MDKKRFPDSPDEILTVRIHRELWLGDDPALEDVRVWSKANAEEFRPVEIHEQAGYSVVEPDRPMGYGVSVGGPTEMMLVRKHDGPVTEPSRRWTSFGGGYMNEAPIEDIPPELAAYLLGPEGMIAAQELDRTFVAPPRNPMYRWQNPKAPERKRPPE